MNQASHPDWDRGAMASLMREVQTTHLFVWAADAGGLLTSTAIPVSDIAQQVRLAGRVVENNPDEAMRMLNAASQKFDRAAQRWEMQARQSEEKLRAARATGRLNEAKARHNAVRTRIAPIQSLFKRAAQSLGSVER